MTFRLGLIGGGRMGRTHIRALVDSSEVTVVAIAEPFEQSAEQLRSEGFTVYPTIAQLLVEAELDGVLIAAPSDKHLEVVTQVAQAGLPILCEKPCGVAPEQAAQAIAVAKDAGVLMQVAYWRRFVPELVALREQIASGKLGTLHLLVCSQWDEAPPPSQFRSSSGGIFIDMGVHEIDQARWLTGCEVVEMSGYSHPETTDAGVVGDVDSAQALLHMSDGTTVLVSLGRFFPGGDMVTAEAFGTLGHTLIPVVAPADGEANQLHALRLQAEAFANNVKGAPIQGATGHDAHMALELAYKLTRVCGIS